MTILQQVNLTKGQRVNLGKGEQYKKLKIVVGWEEPMKFEGAESFDVDVSAFCLVNRNGKKICPSPDNMVFYNNPSMSDVIVYHGDVRSAKTYVEEVIDLDLEKLLNYAVNNEQICQIDLIITIFEAQNKKQTFGQLSNANVKIIDPVTNNIVLQYDLAEKYSTETAVLAASLYRNSENALVFKAEGGGFAVGLEAFCVEYGLQV